MCCFPVHPTLNQLLHTPTPHLCLAPHSTGVNSMSKQVTLVLTDVEGSTELWEWDTEVMSAAIDMHDRVLRSTMSKFFGYEVGFSDTRSVFRIRGGLWGRAGARGASAQGCGGRRELRVRLPRVVEEGGG